MSLIIAQDATEILLSCYNLRYITLALQKQWTEVFLSLNCYSIPFTVYYSPIHQLHSETDNVWTGTWCPFP